MSLEKCSDKSKNLQLKTELPKQCDSSMEIQDELCLFKDGNHEDDSVCLNTDTPSLLKTENKDQNLNYCVEAPSTEMLGMLKSDIQDSCENLSDTSEKDENETNPNSGKYRLSKTKQVEQNCDAEKCDQNLNATKTSCTDTFDILPSDTQDIDENIRNTLAESENTTNANNIVAETCNSNKKSYTIQESLIKKVNNLDISEQKHIDAQKKSNVILKQETTSLKNLLVYGNSSDEEDNIDIDKNWQLNVADSSSDSDSDSDSNDSIESISDGSDDTGSHVSFGQNDKGAIKKVTAKVTGSVRMVDEYQDLAPVLDVSNLNINYEKEEFLHMGHVQAIIDALVTVEALPGTPAYDLDSYLFVEDKTTKKPLGAIYDVIGPVTAPIYCIRFNKIKDINELNIKRGLKVFSAPKSQYTHYVFVKELMKYKGTDASWVGDIELPPEVAAELSDDEDQHNLQEVRKAQKRKHGSLERHQHFEESMNRCNTLKTRMAQISDIRRQMHRTIGYSNNPHRFPNDLFGNDNRFFANENSPLNRIPVPFDPTVPPPGLYSGFPSVPRQNAPPTNRFYNQWGWLPHEPPAPFVPPIEGPFVQAQNNSANYYTNNAGRSHAGPSTQPF